MRSVNFGYNYDIEINRIIEQLTRHINKNWWEL